MDPRPWHRAYDPGVLAALDYETLTLTDALRRVGRRWPDAPAVVLAGHVTRYARLLAQVEALAAHLRASGLQPGERVSALGGMTLSVCTCPTCRRPSWPSTASWPPAAPRS